MNQEKLNYFKDILEKQLETLLVQSGHTVSELVASKCIRCKTEEERIECLAG